jgi:hypothetical protein
VDEALRQADLNYHDYFSHLSIHVSWPGSGDPLYLYNPGDANARVNFWPITGVPKVWIDGWYAPTQYSISQAIIQRHNKSSPLAIQMSGNITGDSGFLDAWIWWAHEYTGDTANLKCYFAIAENDLYAGSRHYDYTMRDILPTALGIPLEYGGQGSSESFHVDFDVDPVWKLDDLVAYFWVQDTTNDPEGRKEVIQAARVEMDDWASAVVETSWGQIKAMAY